MKACAFKNDIIGDWMRPDAVTIQWDATLEEAIARMRKQCIHHLIVKEGSKYRGILDARDCAGHWDKKQRVGSLIRNDIPLIDEQTDIKAVVEMMVSRSLTALPLKRAEKVCGIITIIDLVRLLEREINPRGPISNLLNRGKDFLAQPIVQRLSSLLENAGI